MGFWSAFRSLLQGKPAFSPSVSIATGRPSPSSIETPGASLASYDPFAQIVGIPDDVRQQIVLLITNDTQGPLKAGKELRRILENQQWQWPVFEEWKKKFRKIGEESRPINWIRYHDLFYRKCFLLAQTLSAELSRKKDLEQMFEYDIPRVQVLAAANGCAFCGGHVGEILTVSAIVQISELPPFHPGCRCTFGSAA